jgi:ureidoacrylate peracid hydrolase
MSIRIDPAETALLVIDMQNGFCHPEGTLGLGGVDTGPMQASVPWIRRLVGLARESGLPDIWSRQFHYPVDRTREAHRIGSHVLKRPRPACMPGTWDAEIVDGLRDLLRPETEIIDKHKFSCFFDTRLHSLLRIQGTRMLIICGTATNTCVEATVRDAYMRDFDVIIAREGVSGVNAAWHETALQVWDRYFGAVLGVDQIAEALGVPAAAAATRGAD